MPMRLSDGILQQNQFIKRHPLKHREEAFCGRDPKTPFPFSLRFDSTQMK
jgi:hypothetical protein